MNKKIIIFTMLFLLIVSTISVAAIEFKSSKNKFSRIDESLKTFKPQKNKNSFKNEKLTLTKKTGNKTKDIQLKLPKGWTIYTSQEYVFLSGQYPNIPKVPEDVIFTFTKEANLDKYEKASDIKTKLLNYPAYITVRPVKAKYTPEKSIIKDTQDLINLLEKKHQNNSLKIVSNNKLKKGNTFKQRFNYSLKDELMFNNLFFNVNDKTIFRVQAVSSLKQKEVNREIESIFNNIYNNFK
jgi:hypothetical protein